MQGLMYAAELVSVHCMWHRSQSWVLLFYRAGKNLVGNYGLEMAGYLTFLALLSLFPYMLLMASAAGLIGQAKPAAASFRCYFRIYRPTR